MQEECRLLEPDSWALMATVPPRDLSMSLWSGDCSLSCLQEELWPWGCQPAWAEGRGRVVCARPRPSEPLFLPWEGLSSLPVSNYPGDLSLSICYRTGTVTSLAERLTLQSHNLPVHWKGEGAG